MSFTKLGHRIGEFIKQHSLAVILSSLIFGNSFWISEKESLDIRFKFRGEKPGNTNIVLIDIDDESFFLRPPWDLQKLEKLLLPIINLHPAAIGIDLRFYGNPQNYIGNLQQFIDKISQFSIPIVIAVACNDDQIIKPEFYDVPSNVFFGSVTLVDSYYPESDQVIRRVRLLHRSFNNDSPIFAFSLQLIAAAQGINPIQSVAELKASGLNGSRSGYYLINYYNNYRHSSQTKLQYNNRQVDKFRSIQAIDLLNFGRFEKSDLCLSEDINDSTIVLVGATYQDQDIHTQQDWFRTPLSWKETISGVVVHANILSWLLNESFIYEPTFLIILIITIGLIFLCWLLLHFISPKKALTILILIFIIYIMMSVFLFTLQEIWIPLIWPLRITCYFIILLNVINSSVSYLWKKKLRWLLPKSTFPSRLRRIGYEKNIYK